MTPEEARAAWRAAETFEELCELGAQFIEGTSPYFPGYGVGTVDDETIPLIPALAVLNRSGFLTAQSQPGAVGDGWKQRAFVTGWATQAVALRLAQKALYTSLFVDFLGPWEFPVETRYIVPLTEADGHPYTQYGPPFDHVGDLPIEDLGLEAGRQFLHAWCVFVVDLEWGREDYLWRALSEHEPGYSVNWHPDLGEGEDYPELEE